MGEATTSKTNYLRRGFGLVVGCSPLVLLCGSVLYGLSHGDRPTAAGLIVELAALLVAGLNVHLAFVRRLLHRRRTGSLEGYRRVSGMPLLGTLLVVIGALLGFGSLAVAVLGLAAFVADTGGSMWFVIATWRDSSLWDAPSATRRRP